MRCSSIGPWKDLTPKKTHPAQVKIVVKLWDILSSLASYFQNSSTRASELNAIAEHTSFASRRTAIVIFLETEAQNVRMWKDLSNIWRIWTSWRWLHCHSSPVGQLGFGLPRVTIWMNKRAKMRWRRVKNENILSILPKVNDTIDINQCCLLIEVENEIEVEDIVKRTTWHR